MKDKIRKKLEEIGIKVFYGAGKFRGDGTWDCIVYGKRRMRNDPSSNKITQEWFVAIVSEESIPEGTELKVIEKMREAGLKKTGAAAEYSYTEKSGECMVEICAMEFFKSEKRC